MRDVFDIIEHLSCTNWFDQVWDLMILGIVLLGMAATGVSSVKFRNPRRFMTLLSSSACEWFLIFMLFVDAALSYLLTKFAHYCDLQTPCLFCSRIEYVFGKNKHGYYRNLLCCNHREEISSFIYCHIHCKLADVHSMCEDCLMSLARSSKSNSESCRLLVAKLGVEIEESGLKNILLNKSFLYDSSGPMTCSCCNKQLRVKSNAQRLLQVIPVGFGASKANAKPPLPRVPGRSHFSRRDSLRRLRDKISGPMAPRPGGNTGVDTLSHVGYTELKITSDSESEVPFTDDDDAASAFHGNNDIRIQSTMQGITRKVPKVLADDSSPGNQNHQTPEPLPSLLDQPVQLESSELSNVSYLESSAFVKHGLEELNWTQPNPKPSTSGLGKLILVEDVPQSAENHKPSAFPQLSDLSILSELLSLNNVHSSSNVVKISEKSDATGTSENGKISIAKHTIEAGFTDGSNSSMSNNVSTNALAYINKEGTEAGVLAEPLTTGMVEEALKSPSRIYSDMDLSSKDTSPRVNGHHDGLQKSEASGSDAIDMVQMAALERHDSGHESLDGIIVKEIEGETSLDRLKRQVEYDRRCMKALFKELEEERNAAAIAANQAMAMITRLQEEKAALHTEALQYLRMMEEQAEYDMETLEKTNDLLAEREKEMQDLEAEFEIYRNNILGEPMEDSQCKETSNATVESKMNEECRRPRVKNGPSATDDSKSTDMLKGRSKPKPSSSPVLEFEDEKLHISQCLKMLEKKFHQVSRNGVIVNLANGEYAEHITKEVDDGEELPDDIGIQINHQKKETVLSLQKDLSAPNGSPGKDLSADIVQKNHLLSEESDGLDVGQYKLSTLGGESKLDTFKSETIDIKDRLEALEMDRYPQACFELTSKREW